VDISGRIQVGMRQVWRHIEVEEEMKGDKLFSKFILGTKKRAFLTYNEFYLISVFVNIYKMQSELRIKQKLVTTE